MKYIYWSIFLILVQTSTAQNWNPFPENQETYWLENDSIVRLYYNTSIQNDTLFMGKHCFDEESIRDCESIWFADVLLKAHQDSFPDNEVYQNIPEPIFGDYFIQSDSQILFDDGDIAFKPSINIGESWGFSVNSNTVDSIHIHCDSIGLGTFLEVEDSLKYFTITTYFNDLAVDTDLNNKTIILSKTYGFVQFLRWSPLKEGKAQKLIIDGFSNTDGTIKGFTNSFYDYYKNYEAGDLRFYKRGLYYSYQYHYIDSISAVTVTNDKVTISGIHFRNHQGDVISEPFEKEYTRAKIPLMPMNVNQIHFYLALWRINALIKRDGHYYLNTKTIDMDYEMSVAIANSIGTGPSGENLYEYLINVAYLIEYDYIYNSILGRVWFFGGAADLPQNFELLGFKRNGNLIYGYIGDLTTITPIANQTDVSIQPSLVRDIIKINRKSTHTNAQLEIIDLSGKSIQQFQMYRGMEEKQLDLSYLPKGIYHIIYTREGQGLVLKFIKQ